MPETLKGRWYWFFINGKRVLIPVERWNDWCAWLSNFEPGEYSSILPNWVIAMPDNVVITEVEVP